MRCLSASLARRGPSLNDATLEVGEHGQNAAFTDSCRAVIFARLRVHHVVDNQRRKPANQTRKGSNQTRKGRDLIADFAAPLQ